MSDETPKSKHKNIKSSVILPHERITRGDYLRNEAVPGVIFKRDMFEYCALTLALCTAFASTADMLLKLAASKINITISTTKS